MYLLIPLPGTSTTDQGMAASTVSLDGMDTSYLLIVPSRTMVPATPTA